MIHLTVISEETDTYLSSFYIPAIGRAVKLASHDNPHGWAMKGGKTYEISYDDVSGDVDMKEVEHR